ncbi:BapA/Bap/LapF family large adhesin [Sphingomonas aracearum]|uniref:BapA prefix-like domain-containing protein n=1 Tax=Sphingomonas aracearum TaxID=2283317 RepID=A0A369VTX8_9SPHN|nr:BapA/Bap/LapF family large adhesin [Sphingomonas aracearum]RDE04987.1 hypothetical protein DVW87_15650 [Sphingomonas aracearum]
MAVDAEVISKVNGTVTQVAADTIDLDAPSIVRLHLDRSQLANLEQEGEDLLVTLKTGEVIRVEDFYQNGAPEQSDLVLQERDGQLWQARAAGSTHRFKLLSDIGELLGGEGAGGSALAVPLVGALGAGGIAAVASDGGDSGTSSNLNSGTPTAPGGGTTPLPDSTAPAAPTVAISANGATVSGRGEAGATVEVRNAAGAVIGSSTVAASGDYTLNLATPSTNGETLTITQRDAAGNVSASVQATAPDTTAPAAPTVAIDANGATVSGTGEPGATLEVRNAAGVVVGTAAVGANGAYSVTLATPSTNGETLTITQRDAAGNVSASVQATAPDTTAPAAPNAQIDATGTILSGTGEPGAQVSVRDPEGTSVATAQVGTDGTYSVTLPAPRVDGTPLTVVQTDANGNASPAATLLTPDLIAPAAPTVEFTPGGASITGTAEPGATVTVEDGSGTVLGTATIGPDGTYSVPLAAIPPEGSTITVGQADPAGNPSPTVSVTVPDLAAPAAPTIVVRDDGAAASGTGEPGATVTLTDPTGAVLGTAVVAADGSYAATLQPAQVNAERVTATQTDAAGNVSAPASDIAPDLTAPLAPTLAISADGAAVTGTGEPGATVTIRSPLGAVIGTALVAADGSYAATLSAAQTNGEVLTATQSDPAGNLSPEASATAPDLVANTNPDAPTTAVSADGGFVTGTAQPGAAITVYDANGVQVAAGTAAADGSYSVALSPPRIDGETIRVTQTEADGDVSPPATATAPDLTAPDAPTIAINADGTVATGTGEPGATVTLTDPSGAVLGTALVQANGSYTATLNPPQTDAQVVTATQADAAGNVSGAATDVAPDFTAPAAPTLSISADGTVAGGTGEPGATVTLTGANGAVIGTALVAADGSFATPLTPPLTNGEPVVASQTDAAGNASPAASAVSPDFTAPGAPSATIGADGAQVTGTGEPGAQIVVRDGAGTVLGTATVAADGSYVAALAPAPTNGEALVIQQADPAGNFSPPVQVTAPDITPPAAPAATLDASGSVITGTGEPGAQVEVRDAAAAVIGTAVVTPQGAFTLVLATPQVAGGTLSVVQADAAGNTSAPTALAAPDRTAPAAPTLAISADGAAVTGTGEPGASVTIRSPLGAVIGSAVVAADGSYAATLSAAQTNGEVLTATQSDPAGNLSPQANATAPDLVANTNPDAPTAVVSADGGFVTGTAQPGAAITVYDANGVQVAAGTAAADGSYSVALSPPRIDGETIRVTQTEADGDVSPPAAATAPDLTAPAAPAAAIDGTGVVVTGTGEPGATVRVLAADGTVLGTATVGASGAFAVPLTPPQANGEPLSVVQTDPSGNPSAATALAAPDITAPLAPVATIAGDGSTATGTGEPGATITVVDANGIVIGAGAAAADGTFTVALSPAQANGGQIALSQTDAAGNASPPLTLAAPDVTAPVPPSATVSANGTSVSGLAEPGATVTVTGAGGLVLGSGVAGANGSYTVAIAPAQANGEQVAVTQADAAGNVSPATPAIAPDITAPAAPTIDVGADGATTTGTGEPGATVTLTGPTGAVLATALVAADGTYAATLNPAQLNGEVVTATQRDAAGNVSGAATDIAPDVTAPAAPTIDVGTDGASVAGTGEPGATVTITDPAGTVLATALVAADGTYTAALVPAQIAAQLVTATQTDAAGNLSGAATDVAPDLTAPAAPVAAIAADGSAVSGTGEAGAAITVSDPAGTVLATGTAGADGIFTIALVPPRDNGGQLSVVQTDVAGNASPAAAVIAPDLIPPAVPTIAISGDGAAVTGAGEPGASVTIVNANGDVLGTAIVGSDGQYGTALTPPQVNGEQVFATQVDPGGNASDPASAVAPDFTAPATPVVAIAADGTAATGTGEPGAAVSVTGADGTPLGSAIVGADGTFRVPLAPAQVEGETLTVRQTDVADNPSGAVTVLAPDLDAPLGLTAAVNADGTIVTGAGEVGATVTVRDPAGAVIGTATVAADGTYTAALTTPQRNGETLTATQADAEGNVSLPVTTAAPDLTPPAVPTAAIGADGAVVTGTGEAGATVSVTNAAGTVVGTGPVAADGSFSVTLTPAQADGGILTVVQADPTGNLSPTTTVAAPDITPPALPTLAISADGTIATGTGEPGATVTITDPAGTAIGSGVVDGAGTYTAALAPAQVNGQLLTATQADVAGNPSAPATAVAPDGTAPLAPTIAISADGATVTGTGEPGARVVVTSGGGVVGATTVAADGSYAVQLDPPLVNAEPLTATQTDAAGNGSPTASTIAPDLTPPAAPVAAVAGDGGSVTGTGEPGATVTIANAAGTAIGTAVVDAGGAFTATLTTPQRNGETLSLTQRDAAGNVSPAAAAVAPDLTPPAVPAAAVAADGSAVTGTGEPGATVTVSGAAGVLGSAVVAGDGTFAVPLASPQANGQALTVVQTDAAGNASPVVPLIAPDITPPAAPTLAIAADGATATGTGEPGAVVSIVVDGAVVGTATVAADGTYTAPLAPAQIDGGLVTATQADVAGNISTPASAVAPDATPPAAPVAVVSADGGFVTGTGEPGATVTVTNAAGTVLGTATVAGDGRYAVPLNDRQDDGETLTVRQADQAGNLSPATTIVAPDDVPPLIPVASVTADGGAVVGTGLAGATVTVTGATGGVLGTALVQPDGSYSVALNPPQRNGEVVSVTQADTAGNVSPPVPAVAPDLTAPAAPTASVSGDGGSVTGTGEAGSRVTVTTLAGAVLGTALVGADGLYLVPLTSAQRNGETVVATQADAAGNTSPAATAIAPDLTAPAAPAALAISPNGATVTGTGEAGARVEVRNAGGQLLGTGTVGTDGAFSVGLSPAQQAGGTLGVTLADAAGNRSGTGTVAAPFDIDAFDNANTAAIDLQPVTTGVNLGTANYLALVSLGAVNLNAQVLGVPSVNFTVQEGHTLNAVFTYDALANIGALSGYAVAVQRFDGTNWVAVDTQGAATLVQVGLLNGNVTATETLGAGQYRAFLTFQGTAGVGLLGALTVTGTDLDYTDVGAAVPAATQGNVITDASPAGEIDIVAPGTRVASVTVNGVTTAVVGDGTAVTGSWGTLLINLNGSYTYTPAANAAAIGHTDTFTYTLIDPSDGELESANLSIAIGSPDITGAPLAVNDTATAAVTYQNVSTTIAPAQEFTFNTPLSLGAPRTGSGADSFTVAANTVSDVTLTAVRGGTIALFPSYTITVRNAAGAVVGTTTQTAVAGLPLGAGVSLTLDDLPAGTYTYTVSSTNTIGTGYGTTVYIGENVTFLDRYTVTGTTAATGDLLANDTPNADFYAVRIGTGATFTEVGDTPLSIAGRYGTLTVTETGDYTYRPSGTLPYSAVDLLDSFTYQLVQPNGVVSTATLNVRIDVPGDNAAPVATTFAVENDVVSLAMVAGPEAHPATGVEQHDASVVVGGGHPDVQPTGIAPFDLFEGQGDVPDVLARYLDEHAQAQPAPDFPTVAPAPEAVPIEHTASDPVDPLGYLALPVDQTREEDHSRMTV